MAPLPIVPGVVEILIKWQVGEDSSASSKLYASTGATSLSQADLTTLANAIANQFGNLCTNYASSQVKLLSVSCIDLSSAAQTTGVSTVGTATGTRAGGFLPANVCVLANYRIARRYRGGKPRTYFPLGTQTDLQDSQLWQGSSLTNFQTAIGTAISNSVTATGGAITLTGHVNVSYYSGSTWVAVGTGGRTKRVATRRTTPLVDPVLAMNVSPKPASQRRRMLR